MKTFPFLILITAVLSAAVLAETQRPWAKDGGETTKEDVYNVMQTVECGKIKTLHWKAGLWEAYGLPAPPATRKNGRDIPAKPFFLVRNELYGSFTTPSGLEFQNYKRGEKVYLVPVWTFRGDGNPNLPDDYARKNPIKYMVVYRPYKAKLKIAETKYVNGIPYGTWEWNYQSNFRDILDKTRRPGEWSWFDKGLQDPYILHEKFGYTDYIERRFVYRGESVSKVWEACEPVAVLTPTEAANIENAMGCSPSQKFDFNNPSAYFDTYAEPYCLAKWYLEPARLEKLEETLAAQETAIRFVASATPIVGTAVDFVDCRHVQDPACGARLMIGLTGDIGTMLIPLSRTATAGKAMVGIAVAGDLALSVYDASRGDVGRALSDLTRATANFIDLRSLKVNDSLAVSAVSKKTIVDAPAPICPVPKKTICEFNTTKAFPEGKICPSKTCCPPVVPALLKSAAPKLRNAISPELVRPNLAPYVQELFESGPGTWVKLPNNPQGTPFMRGLSGDYSLRNGGVDEAINLLKGSPSGHRRHAYLYENGCETKYSRLVAEYAEPMSVKGRHPSAVPDGPGADVGSYQADLTIDSIEAIGLPIPEKSTQLYNFGRYYQEMYSKYVKGGMQIDPNSTGAKFYNELDELYKDPRFFTFDHNVNDYYLSDEVGFKNALGELLNRYRPTNTP